MDRIVSKTQFRPKSGDTVEPYNSKLMQCQNRFAFASLYTVHCIQMHKISG